MKKENEMNQETVMGYLKQESGWQLQHGTGYGTTYLYHVDQAGHVDTNPERVPGWVLDGLLKRGKLVMVAESGTYQYFQAASEEQVMKFEISLQQSKVNRLRAEWEMERSHFQNSPYGSAQQRGYLHSMHAADRRLTVNQARLDEMRFELKQLEREATLKVELGGAL